MSLFFDDQFMKSLPDDQVKAGYEIARRFLQVHSSISLTEELKHYPHYLDALGLFQAFAQSYGLILQFPVMESNLQNNVENIVKFFEKMHGSMAQELSKGSVASAKAKYLPHFGKTFLYEFSEGDLKRIQEIINELRDLLTKSTLFEEGHKQRLLKRLERLQSELHKKATNLDRFWGLIGDAGVALGKFGNDAKPIVDRIRELVEIIWRTQARAEELPSASPFPQLTDGKTK